MHGGINPKRTMCTQTAASTLLFFYFISDPHRVTDVTSAPKKARKNCNLNRVTNVTTILNNHEKL